MSAWTYINANIEVNFGNQTDYFIRDFFDSRRKDKNYTLYYDPKEKGDGFEITGSEINAVVVAEPLRNHVLNGRDRYWHGQTYSVTVSGSLRDREIDETISEWLRFYAELKKFVDDDCSKASKSYDFDNTVYFPRIYYYNVDISNGVERYHKCSLDDEDLKKYVPGEKR